MPEEIYIPLNYYIDINSPIMSFGRYKHTPQGDCQITVYKSIDRKKWSSPPIEHVIPVGEFEVKNAKEMDVADFLTKIREGIEEVIKKDKK